MQSYATIDDSEFPIVWVRFTGEKSTDENFQVYLDDVKNSYASKKTLALIFDATNAGVPELSHQKMQANWLKENEGLMKSFCAGTAYIIPNSIIRAILNAIFVFQKQPIPYKVFANKVDAGNWAESILQKQE